MRIRLIEVDATKQSETVAMLMASASLDRSCMVLSFRTTGKHLLSQLEEIGGDPDHVFILDAVDQNPMAAGRQGNLLGGFNPSMMERVLLRAKQIIDREKERDLTLIVDGLDEIMAANPPEAVLEIGLRIREELFDDAAEVDWMVRPGFDAHMMNFLQPLTDTRVRIKA